MPLYTLIQRHIFLKNHYKGAMQPMLYPKNQEPSLSRELFRNPTAEYRGTPFWSWNCDLNTDLMDKEVDCMQQMGMGGYHMHVRVGMNTKYLSDEFMAIIRHYVEMAKERNMLAWLYDEDKWPSGYAGGYVTKDKRFRQRYLLFTPTPYAKDQAAFVPQSSMAEGGRTGQGELLGAYAVELDADGYLKGYRRLSPGETAQGDLWYAYLETMGDSSWYNYQAYVDTLYKPAIDRFVEVTHQRYKEVVGDEFSKTIPAIFTDEPQFVKKQPLSTPFSKQDVVIPFTIDLEETYTAAYGDSLLDHLPELFWDLPEGQVSLTRYHYHDHVAERFASAFADTVGGWCTQNHLLLTGHMMEEPSLWSQTTSLGETMRSYRSFGLPGIDMLCDGRELNTAKQCQSAVHQFGCPGMLSELYGVTGWDFDFRNHKLAGDWQAALGVTVRVHHLYWVSMGGEAKRDYPASIGHQSPWYKEYPYIENHFARVNTALTRGRPVARIGVIHPVESYWLHWGPDENTRPERDAMDKRFCELTDWLLYGLMDFDFISESLLPQQFTSSEEGFHVGQMVYDTVIVPHCETLRSTTLSRLTEYVDKGGRVIFAGAVPRYVDAVPSEEPAKLAARCLYVDWDQKAILDSIDDLRELDILTPDGTRCDNLITQTRLEEDGTRRLFISHVRRPENPDDNAIESYRVCLNGLWKPLICDTISGEIAPAPVTYEDGFSIIPWECGAQGSLLLELQPGMAEEAPAPVRHSDLVPAEVVATHKVPVTLLEPNSLLLDMAEFRIDDGPWHEKEEILRVDNLARRELGFPRRCDSGAQPWVLPDTEEIVHTLTLRLTVRSEIPVRSPKLALENAENVTITVNGQVVTARPEGYFVDASIATVQLPDLPEGESQLLLSFPFGKKTVVEWCYLLGDFGVRLDGCQPVIVPPVRELDFGDWSQQNLAFYAGSLTYHCTVEGDGEELILEAPSFRNPLLRVEVDGRRAGTIAISPYQLSLGKLSPGTHKLDITAYGNRYNAFGALHNWKKDLVWYGPDAWFTDGENWRYDYHLRPIGILKAPRLLKIKK